MSNNYWAKAPKAEIAKEISAKFEEHLNHLATSGYGDLIQLSYDSYYNMAEEGGSRLFLSKDKSNAKIKVNHIKSLIQRIHSMTTNAKLSYVAKARNSDAKSLVQADFAKGLLEYYNDEWNMNEYTSELAERALVMLLGFIYAPWDKSQGVEVVKDDNGIPIMTGDQSFTCLSAFDVAYHHKIKKSPYYIVRVPVNKYDLAAEYPEHAEEILSLSLEKEFEAQNRIKTPFEREETSSSTEDLVYKYVLLHNRTKVLPKGRHTEIVGSVVLSDSILKYKRIPVVRLSVSDLLETTGGDSPITSLIPIQQPMDKLWSAVTTNNLATAKSSFWSKTAIEIQQLSEGLNNIVSPEKPEVLQLTQSAGETYKLIESYQAQLETLSGVNKTARGNPDSSISTAAGQSMMLAQAVEFIGDFQRQFARACGELGTIVINNLQVFATEPRLAYIGGNSRSAYVREFTSDDISEVERVSCEVGNPMMQNITGRFTLAQEMLKNGTIKDPVKLNEFLRTGQIDSLTEDQFKDSILIRNENEELRRGELPIVSIMDMHPQHILEHKVLANDPAFRYNPDLLENLNAHIREHVKANKEIDPDLAAILGIPPLPSQQAGPTEEGKSTEEKPKISLSGKLNDEQVAVITGLPQNQSIEPQEEYQEEPQEEIQ